MNQSITTPKKPVEVKNHLDYQYLMILDRIKQLGFTKKDRTGVGTKSLFGTQIRVNMQEGFPLLTSKKIHIKGVLTELLWFLGKHLEDDKYKTLGRTNIKYLVDNGCNIWVGDAYKKYLNEHQKENPPFSAPYTDPPLNEEGFINAIKHNDTFTKKWGDLGPIYGEQWCEWDTKVERSIRDGSYPNGEFKWKYETEKVDQIQNVIHQLKTNPDSRRLLISAWNVANVDSMILPPCHYAFQFNTRVLDTSERHYYCRKNGIAVKEGVDNLDLWMDSANIPKRAISLMWNQRSADFPLGGLRPV